MEKKLVFLANYPLQKDMRIRLPRQILKNMEIEYGDDFNIYYSPSTNEIVLKPTKDDGGNYDK